jgi:DNA-binding NarL/FixJ family response regulator
MKEDEKQNNIYDILTRIEIEVTKLIVNGCTDKEIAIRLAISFHTVRRHHQNILQKTKQKNIGGLMKFALNNGLNLEA